MAFPPAQIIAELDLLPQVRDLFNECPFIARQSPEAVRRALLVLRGIEASESDVAAVLEALAVEDEVLA